MRDGDVVAIDVEARSIDLELSESELQARRAALPAFVPSEKAGWLAIYQDRVQPLTQGGTLKPGERINQSADAQKQKSS